MFQQKVKVINPDASKFGYIDNLRGLAIIMVIVVHVADVLEVAKIVFDYGQMGVQLFFVLSAYTLCLSADNRKLEENPVQKFYIRRFFRIAPLYYVGIILFLCYNSIYSPFRGNISAYLNYHWYFDQSFKNVLANFFLIHSFVPSAMNTVVPGGWSIATESTFYAMFPVIFFFYKKIDRNKLLLFSLPVLFYIMLHIVFKYFDYKIMNNTPRYFNIVCQLPVFLTGISMYFLIKNAPAILNKYLVIIAILFITLSGVSLIVFRNFRENAFLAPFLSSISFTFLFLLFKSLPIINTKILARIGQLSFSIYLFHFLFAWEGTKFIYGYLKNILDGNQMVIVGSFLTLVFTMLIAILSEKYIEKPGINLGKKLIQRLQ